MMFSGRIFQTVLQYAGLFLVILLCSEEVRRLLARCRRRMRESPRLNFLYYPLAAVFVILAAALIVNSFLTLFLSVLFSYD